MNYPNSQLINPVLSNYLVPRGQRYRSELSENYTNYSDSYWAKKSEKTTNISDMPAIDSILESPEPYSLSQSVEDTPKYGQFQSKNKGQSINKNYHKYMKKNKTFKFEDYNLIDGTEDHSDYHSYNESFENSRRNIKGRSKRYGDYDHIKRNDQIKNKSRNRAYGYEQPRAMSLRKNTFNNSGR